jgi:plastocyanin domain-containing protein
MKTFTALIIIMIIVFSIGSFVFSKSEGIQNTNSINNQGNEKTQEVILSIKNYNYYPNTIKVKSGIPVRIYLDETVTGCLRSFTIRDFGVAKYLKTPNDYVEFTPNKKGKFTFACSMGMGTGTIIVE